jgi:hypothetical protein
VCQFEGRALAGRKVHWGFLLMSWGLRQRGKERQAPGRGQQQRPPVQGGFLAPVRICGDFAGPRLLCALPRSLGHEHAFL